MWRTFFFFPVNPQEPSTLYTQEQRCPPGYTISPPPWTATYRLRDCFKKTAQRA